MLPLRLVSTPRSRYKQWTEQSWSWCKVSIWWHVPAAKEMLGNLSPKWQKRLTGECCSLEHAMNGEKPSFPMEKYPQRGLLISCITQESGKSHPLAPASSSLAELDQIFQKRCPVSTWRFQIMENSRPSPPPLPWHCLALASSQNFTQHLTKHEHVPGTSWFL